METFVIFILYSFCILISLVGIAGCIIPAIPGPVISYLSLFILLFVNTDPAITSTFFIITGVACALVMVLDYILPLLTARKSGASKYGTWGSVIGMIAGIFFIPPWGIFIGGLLGAIVGEIIAGREYRVAIKAGMGILAGNVASTVLKLCYCVYLLIYCVKSMF